MKVDILDGYCSLNEGCAAQIRRKCETFTSLVRSQERPAGKAKAMHERGARRADAMNADYIYRVFLRGRRV
jgi:hypothetical protein